MEGKPNVWTNGGSAVLQLIKGNIHVLGAILIYTRYMLAQRTAVMSLEFRKGLIEEGTFHLHLERDLDLYLE